MWPYKLAFRNLYFETLLAANIPVVAKLSYKERTPQHVHPSPNMHLSSSSCFSSSFPSPSPFPTPSPYFTDSPSVPGHLLPPGPYFCTLPPFLYETIPTSQKVQQSKVHTRLSQTAQQPVGWIVNIQNIAKLK